MRTINNKIAMLVGAGAVENAWEPILTIFEQMSDSFISQVEDPSKRAKYNINHLNKIAEIFNCSPKDFWPDKAL